MIKVPVLPRGGESRAPGGAVGVKPPVLLVGNFLSPAAIKPTVSAELADRLTDAGWTILTTSGKPRRAERLLDMVGTIWRLRREYAIANVDVFSGPAFVWAEAACWSLRRTGKPYLLTLHGGNLPVFARQRPGRVRRLLESAAAVTTPSCYLFEQMRPYRRDLLVLPNAVDLSAYEFRVRRNARPLLVWLRAFHRIYNPALAPHVVRRLAARFPDIHLTMVGPDKGDGSLQRTQAIAAQLGVHERILLPGGVPKASVPAWLDAADIFLNTTHIDNTPVSVLEAMASGLCVVSTNVGGIPFLVEAEQDALLVPPDDAKAMAAAVSRLLSEPGLAERLSCRARSKAEQFDWSGVLPQWERLLAVVAAGQKP